VKKPPHTFDAAIKEIERLSTELVQERRARSDAIEQQTATADILKVISSSPADTQPVFDAIVATAYRLLSCSRAVIVLRHGDKHRAIAAFDNAGPSPIMVPDAVPIDQTRDLTSRAIVEKRMLHLPDWSAGELPEHERRIQAQTGCKASLYVPLVRQGECIGVLAFLRPEAVAFSDPAIALAQSFADQAVIAIENARLFNETKELLERQTATADILRVISSSPNDVQPVFDAVAERAAQICGATQAGVLLASGNELRRVAYHGPRTQSVHIPIRKTVVNGRAFLERRTVHVPDVLAALDEYPDARENQKRQGFRSLLAVPMLRKGEPIGCINAWRVDVRPFSAHEIKLLETFADQAVIAIENARLFKELETRNKDLTEALEQQTATGDILKVISSSRTDVRPVFETIIRNAVRLCSASHGTVFTFDGNLMHIGAHFNVAPEEAEIFGRDYPVALSADRPSGQAVIERRIVNVPDMLASHYSDATKERARVSANRALLAVPMMRAGTPLGVIAVVRSEPTQFSDSYVSLLQTFADQAVIAIENVRLLNELEARNEDLGESLEQQTATSEILNVISRTPTDESPVFEAIVGSAARLFKRRAVIRLVQGDKLIARASAGGAARFESVPLNGESVTAQALAERRLIELPDTEAPGVPSFTANLARTAGFRTVVYVPLVREGVGIGVIALTHPEAGFRLNENQLALLQTFADQAVIAIENVRLFKELEARNKELTTALDQQTATSDILRTISRAQTDVRPVFDSIVGNAQRLLQGHSAVVTRLIGNEIHLAAFTKTSPEADAALQASYPRRIADMPVQAEVIRGMRPMVWTDSQADQRFLRQHELARMRGYRSFVCVPLLRGNEAIGTINVSSRETREFRSEEIALLQTFADQAVIAIENVRLFTELEARNKDLTEALEQQTATSEVLKVISRTTVDLKPVFDALLDNATRLCNAQFALLGLYEGDEYHYVAHRGANSEFGQWLLDKGKYKPRADGGIGRMTAARGAIHIPDLREAPGYLNGNPITVALADIGQVRTYLSVPMLKEERVVGGITIYRSEVRPFTQKQIDLVSTFANQAVIAIENVRLFNEIQDKTRQLEVANKHKSDFLAHMSHELRTPLNAVIGFSEVLMDKMFGDVNDKQLDYLKDIHESGKHLLSLINDILDLSKIEAGRMDLELSTFHMPTALANAMTLIRERAQRHAIQLGAEVDDRLGDFEGDERKFKQIMLNLLSNAVKFTPDGGRVDVRAKLDTDWVLIAVTDSGIGIAPGDLDRLFEEFQQVGGDSGRKAEGTGLGLALTRRLARLHGGDITVTSEIGKGSTFTVILPMRAEAAGTRETTPGATKAA
jgi:GAF domain-containing protein